MQRVRLIWQGLRFGMLLQIAIGPVCLLVINTSIAAGFWATLPLVLAVALADAIYIALSLFGLSVVMRKPTVQRWSKTIGGLVLILFGADVTMSAMGYPLLPAFSLFGQASVDQLFWKGLLLTLSNPMSILFWSGALSARVAQRQWQLWQLRWFSIGCVLATLCFLCLVAGLGSVLMSWLGNIMITVLNMVVGIVLLGFGIRLLLHGKAHDQ